MANTMGYGCAEEEQAMQVVAATAGGEMRDQTRGTSIRVPIRRGETEGRTRLFMAATATETARVTCNS